MIDSINDDQKCPRDYQNIGFITYISNTIFGWSLDDKKMVDKIIM